MTGVEILSSEIIYNTILPEWWVAIGMILGIVLGAMLGVYIAYGKTILSILCVVGIVGAITLAVLGVTSDENSIRYIEHKVIIDESVSIVEFMDKYEIIDQDGKIYIVRETVQ